MNINLNDGKCHPLEEINNYDKKIIAKQFSEGNRALEELLLKLWHIGIETIACCKGTYEKDHKPDELVPVFKIPYLAINLTPETREKVLTFVEYLLNENGLKKPDIIFKNTLTQLGHSNIIVLERIFLNNSSCDKMFESILSACDKMLLNKHLNKNEKSTFSNELIDNLSSREIINPYIKEISVKISQNGKTQFKIKNKLNKSIKASINSKSIKKIDRIIEEYTDVIEYENNKDL